MVASRCVPHLASFSANLSTGLTGCAVVGLDGSKHSRHVMIVKPIVQLSNQMPEVAAGAGHVPFSITPWYFALQRKFHWHFSPAHSTSPWVMAKDSRGCSYNNRLGSTALPSLTDCVKHEGAQETVLKNMRMILYFAVQRAELPPLSSPSSSPGQFLPHFWWLPCRVPATVLHVEQHFSGSTLIAPPAQVWTPHIRWRQGGTVARLHLPCPRFIDRSPCWSQLCCQHLRDPAPLHQVTPPVNPPLEQRR